MPTRFLLLFLLALAAWSGLFWLWKAPKKAHKSHYLKDVSLRSRQPLTVEDTVLYPIRRGVLWGYLNAAGEVKIKPRFYTAGSFSEELAAVREGGLFGYINTQGEYVIPPKYDYAERFLAGKAKVWQDTVSFEIDIAGRKVTTTNNQGEVTTLTHNQKVVSSVKEGLTFVEGDDFKGFITLNGKKVIDFDFVSKKYNLEKLNAFPPFSSGLVKIRFKKKGENFFRNGYMNEKGEVALTRKEWMATSHFSSGRAFVRTKEKNWFLINTQGEALNNEPYKTVAYARESWLQTAFIRGRAFVESKEGWIQIDTTGSILAGPLKFQTKIISQYNFKGHTLVFKTERVKGMHQCGIWNTNLGIAQYGEFSEITPIGTEILLAESRLSSRLITTSYITTQAEFIPTVTKKAEAKSLNIDFVTALPFIGSYPQYDSLAEEREEPQNPFFPIENTPFFKEGKLNLVLRPKDTVHKMGVRFFRMHLANLSEDSAFAVSLGDELFLWLEAQDKYGNWRKIHHPFSDRENFPTTRHLPPHRQWDFLVPQYDGGFPSKLRARLICNAFNVEKQPYDCWKNISKRDTLYSNEVPTRINPTQFWRHEDYNLEMIMELYME